jgi:short subunit dehydrogenase-like uncharacterized protein
VAGRTVLFGATGYTGRLAAEAMVERGLRPLLAGRRRERLEAMAAELGGLEIAVADVADPAGVRDLVEPGDVLVTTVGPFARWGAPAAAAASSAGAHYIDSTGEPAFIREVFERYGQAAAQSGSAMLTAFGYDWVPGNLAEARRRRRGAGRRRLLRHRHRERERRDAGLDARSRGRAELRLPRRARAHRARGQAGAWLPDRLEEA